MISKRALVFPGIPVLHALEIFQETKYGRRQKGRRPQICLLVVQISTDGKTHRMSSAVQYREFQGQKNPETPEAVSVQPTASKAFISFGAARQIRTADLILTKRPRNFFLTIFHTLWPYPLKTIFFPSLFEHPVSIYSTPHCG